MRDIIWTIILIWIGWKIINAFKNVSKMQTQKVQDNRQQPARKEGEVKVENSATYHKTHFKHNDGEYVEYEEIK